MQRLILPMAGILVLIAAQASTGTYSEGLGVPAEAAYVGADACLDCHDDVEDPAAHSPHAVSRAATVPGTGIDACEACHGPGSLHVEQEGDGFILGAEAISRMSEADRAAMCTQCHANRRVDWHAGPHAGSGVGCADCHLDQMHFTADVTPPSHYRNPSEFCLQCHGSQASDFRLPFRHRVLEGTVTCGDCHDPHADFPDVGWNGMSDVCLACHTEMSGPFVFEHEGVAGEDCVACHRPHGSMNDKLLVTDGGTLCLQCHFETSFGPDDNWELGDANHGGYLGGEARCYDCHTEIHGSNVSPTFRD